MFQWVASFYARRIVNVNVNIVIAGLMAVSLAIIPVHVSVYLGVKEEDQKTIAAILFVSDMIFDVVIYYALHWLANHMPGTLAQFRGVVRRASHVTDAVPPVMPHKGFFKDASQVQLQRAALSPILYIVAYFSLTTLLDLHVRREPAGFLAMFAAIVVTRVLHTIWMIRNQNRDEARLAEAISARDKAREAPAPARADSTPANGVYEHATHGRPASRTG